MAKIDLHQKDTICAATTALMPSAIAMIRVSGPDALAIKEKIFFPKKDKQKFFVATLGNVADIDEGICTTFPKGKSYTGEASFELSLHGSPIIVQAVLEHLQEEGCRMAEPGEFSMRAVLNHKMDLSAAEAVCDLIGARSRQAAQVALKNVKGGLGKYLYPVRTSIIDVLCEMEARLDFPDEDLGEKRLEKLLLELETSAELFKKLLDSSEFGMKLMQGARILLFGLPNAGKSTLLNALLQEERALVHHLPGTTRDVVEASWCVGGIPVSLVDVAGIRDEIEADAVEALGIKKAQEELRRADAVLWLIDGTKEALSEQTFLKEQLSKVEVPVVKVFTKLDLFGKSRNDGISISAKSGEGLGKLQDTLLNLFKKEKQNHEEILLTKERQKVLVQKAYDALLMAYDALKNHVADEVVASELRVAGNALDELLGKFLNEDVLNLIFSRFCIGK